MRSLYSAKELQEAHQRVVTALLAAKPAEGFTKSNRAVGTTERESSHLDWYVSHSLAFHVASSLPPHAPLHETKATEWTKEDDLVASERIIAGAGWDRVVELARYPYPYPYPVLKKTKKA